METQISKDLEMTAYRASYDECCKSLLAHKSILAHILKECVEEFKDCSVEYIAQNCIENNPEISKVNVHRNSKAPEKISGISTEDKTIEEGSVYYDIRFIATLPQSDEVIRLIINIEAQNSFYPGYSLVRRGLYYCCRLISSQYETEFTSNNYNDIKKVYSIWICTNTPKLVQNTITRYKITEDNIVGNAKENKKNYDIMNVIMVCLDKDSKDAQYNYSGVLKLLRVLLSNKLNPKTKKSVLDDDFGIDMDIKLEKELSDMCNLSSGVLEEGIERGIKRGIEEGISKGIKKGTENTKLEDLKNIIENMAVSFEKAATALKIPQNEWEKYKNMLNN